MRTSTSRPPTLQSTLLACLFLAIFPIASAAVVTTPMGIGGGGWISATAFHPDNPDYLIIGTDMSGCYLSTNRGVSYVPWSKGLDSPDLSGLGGGGARYVDDLLPVSREGESGFFAATHAGIYYRDFVDDSWSLQTQGQAQFPLGGWLDVPGPFSSLSDAGWGLLFAGMGHDRYEFDESSTLGDTTPLVWFASVQTGFAGATWYPLDDVPVPAETVRDITAAYVNGESLYVVIATPSGVFMRYLGIPVWNQLSDESDCWSVHLTPEGTLYASFAENGGAPDKGVYRIPNVMVPSPTWVETVNLASTDPCIRVPYMSVAKDLGSGEDRITVATRRQKGAGSDCGNLPGHGVYRAQVDGTDCCTPADSRIWISPSTGPQYQGDLFYFKQNNFEPTVLNQGWVNFWGFSVECAPAVLITDTEYAAVPINAHFFVYDGEVDTWSQAYTTDLQETENGMALWRGRGWHETGVTDFAFTADHAVVAGALDVGAIKSRSDAGASFDFTKWLPLFTVDREENPMQIIEAQFVGARGDDIYLSSGSARVHVGDATTCHFVRYHKVGADQWTWSSIGEAAQTSIEIEGTIVFNDFAFVDDDHVFICYQREKRIPETPTVPAHDQFTEAGVLQLSNNQQADWALSLHSAGLPDASTDLASYASARILYNPNAAYPALWLAIKGGIYRLALPVTEASVWEPVDGLGSAYENCRSIAMSANGDVIYVGTQGAGVGSGSVGAVLMCDQPNQAGPLTWEIVGDAHNFGFATPGGTAWSGDPADKLSWVEAIAVHPQRPYEIYVGLYSEWWSLEPLGVWRSKGKDKLWTRYNALDFNGSGVRSLAFVPCQSNCTSFQLVAGLRGQEMYRMTVTGNQGGPGCPYVYTWDGSAFAQDNTLLAPVNRAAAGTPDANVVDAYVLQQPLVEREGRLDLQIREFERERSWIDQVGLAAVDHPAGTTLSIGPDGAPRLLDGWLTPAEAATADGADVYALLARRDGDVFAGQPGDVVELSYALPAGGLPTDGLTVRSEDKQVEEPILPKGAVAGIAVEAFDPVAGDFVAVGDVSPRERPSLDTVTFTDALREHLAGARQLRLRLTWQSAHRLDFAGLPLPSDAACSPRLLSLASARHSVDGDARGLLSTPDGHFARLEPGETLALSFAAPAAVANGMQRSYVLRATGHYLHLDTKDEPTGEPLAFGLEPNVPNPFNPKTQLAFTLPAPGAVSLRIYAVSGRLVRELATGRLEAGRHVLDWDGRDAAGAEQSSGIYFARLVTPFGEQRTKMTLLR